MDQVHRIYMLLSLYISIGELDVLRARDAELARSEAELSQWLWEVQERRRRNEAMARMLQQQLASISDEVLP